MKKTYYFLLIASLGWMACNQQTKKETPAKKPETEQTAPSSACNYHLKTDSTKVFWTAFKHTAKVPVKGLFDSTIVQTQNNTAETIDQILIEASFKIYTSSVNSGDEGRDAKIRSFYFDKLTNGNVISGNILKAENGKAEIELTINDITKTIHAKYAPKDNILQLKAAINMEQFNAQESITALQDACKEKHTGSDGVTKLWPEVEILVQAPLKKSCN